MSWLSVSTEHGPATVTNSSPPTKKSRTGTIVRWLHAPSRTSGLSANSCRQLSRTRNSPSGLQCQGSASVPRSFDQRLHRKVETRWRARAPFAASGESGKHRFMRGRNGATRFTPAQSAAGDSRMPRPPRQLRQAPSRLQKAVTQSARRSASRRANSPRESLPPAQPVR